MQYKWHGTEYQLFIAWPSAWHKTEINRLASLKYWLKAVYVVTGHVLYWCYSTEEGNWVRDEGNKVKFMNLDKKQIIVSKFKYLI